jgi:UDP-N-acetylglucosamine acyltransferase
MSIEFDDARAPSVHPSSVVDPAARLGRGVRIGPFCVVGPHVQLGDGVVVHSHATIDGHTTLGERVEVFPGAAVGLRPQDLKYDGSATRLVVGARTVIRECVTLQPGSLAGALTSVGADCLIMAYCHVAHDCVVGDRVIMANGAQLAGHTIVEDGCVIGGMTTVHQFVRIGTRAITGAASRVQQDVPPFTMADGHPARLFGLNTVGLKRAGFSPETRRALKRAYRALFLGGRYAEALRELEGSLATEHPEVDQLCRFLRASTRGVTRAPARGLRRGDDEGGED